MKIVQFSKKQIAASHKTNSIINRNIAIRNNVKIINTELNDVGDKVSDVVIRGIHCKFVVGNPCTPHAHDEWVVLPSGKVIENTSDDSPVNNFFDIHFAGDFFPQFTDEEKIISRDIYFQWI